MTSFNQRVSGSVTGTHFEPDILAIKKTFMNTIHYWIECKIYTIGLPILRKLERDASDVFLANKIKKADWKPDVLCAVTMTRFTEQALEYANKRDIYCLKFKTMSYSLSGKRSNTPHFEGKMTLDDFMNGVSSHFSKT